MANGQDRAVGAAALLVSVFIFVYYTIWALVLPFVDENQPVHNFFPDRSYAITIPVVLLICGLTVIFGFLALVMIKSQKKRKSKSN
ncbi:uncharacterized protein VTP21DRAFT_2293 [Calcarisporiella thermophila]|uniref:uncharacterized protein n=1 Tax=Calcarisporiella thermophila TaxID=911321 RepID=UPI003743519A